ncbi:class I adenylate-forming enzyme family protein [Streptomyces sp. NPDC001978]|uniref:class I adenylate-forming enzyme family protein n=1 Tax=Streptomyces sp. NPDC001978 TaxID=3364627 RepID=UPI00368D3564
MTDSLWRAIATRSAKAPDAPLIVEADGATYSNGRAAELVSRWGRTLRAVGMGGRVATVLPNQAALHLLRMASGHAGLPFAALNPLLRGRMLADALLRTSASDIIVSAETAELVGEVQSLLPVTVRVHLLDGDELTMSVRRGGGSAPPFNADPDPDRTLAIVYTSGTSGPAKPVLLSASVLHLYGGTLFDDQDRTWPAGAGYYCPWHPAHILGAVALDTAVRRNLVLVLRRKFDHAAFWSDIRRHDCRLTVLVAVAADVWAARRPDQQRNPLELVGMAPLIPSLDEFERYFGVQTLSIYGMTEVGTVLVDRSPANCRTTGRPVPGYKCRLEPVPDLETRAEKVGELVVRPVVPTSEYDTTNGPPLAVWHDGWFHTGDLFIEVDGSYSYIGRIKDCIRRRGRNISSADLEALIREISGVFDCACVGVSDANNPPGDDDDIRLFIQPAPGVELDVARVVEQSRRRLPWFMLPRYVDVVDELPRTPSGKLARGVLRQLPLGTQTYDRKQFSALGVC